jgi:hypothetical protein
MKHFQQVLELSKTIFNSLGTRIRDLVTIVSFHNKLKGYWRESCQIANGKDYCGWFNTIGGGGRGSLRRIHMPPELLTWSSEKTNQQLKLQVWSLCLAISLKSVATCHSLLVNPVVKPKLAAIMCILAVVVPAVVCNTNGESTCRRVESIIGLLLNLPVYIALLKSNPQKRIDPSVSEIRPNLN